MPIKSLNSILSPGNLKSFNGVLADSISTVNGIVLPEASSTGIIATNLVQHLDAGLSSSYSGSGTLWTDLSGSGVHGTLLNAPTYSSSDGGGSFSFNGTDESVRFDYDDAAPIRIGEDSPELDVTSSAAVTGRVYGDVGTDGGFTVQMWVKQLSTSGVPDHFSAWNNNGSVSSSSGTGYQYYQGIEVIMLGGATYDGALILYLFDAAGSYGPTLRRDVRTNNSVLSSYVDSWVNIAITLDDDTGSTMDDNVVMYVQGVPIDAGDYSSGNPQGTGDGVGYRAKYQAANTQKRHGGVGLSRGIYRTGGVSQVAVYNDILTDAEILANYNATKARYGY